MQHSGADDPGGMFAPQVRVREEVKGPAAIYRRANRSGFFLARQRHT